MNVGIITVRKRWNNAPSFLIEGIKQGIRELLEEKYNFKNVRFIFSKFTIHTPTKLYIDPESIKDFDVILIPFWIGAQILDCNLHEIKQNNNTKICMYSGHAPYHKRPPYQLDLITKKFSQGQLSDNQWKNFNAIDYFFVVNKFFPLDNEIEIGCGKFDWLKPNKSKINCIILDSCKRNWDEHIWNDFRDVWADIRKNCDIELIQFGEYPYKFDGAKIFNKSFVHYRKLCKLYSKIKIYISMNESFGYSILENKYAGNLILLNENAEIPSCHLNSNYIKTWNKSNIIEKINNFIHSYDENTSEQISNEFIKCNPNFANWKKTVSRLIDELSKI